MTGDHLKSNQGLLFFQGKAYHKNGISKPIIYDSDEQGSRGAGEKIDQFLYWAPPHLHPSLVIVHLD